MSILQGFRGDAAVDVQRPGALGVSQLRSARLTSLAGWSGGARERRPWVVGDDLALELISKEEIRLSVCDTHFSHDVNGAGRVSRDHEPLFSSLTRQTRAESLGTEGLYAIALSLVSREQYG